MDKDLLEEICTYLLALAAGLRLVDRFVIEGDNMQLARPTDVDEPEGRILILLSDTIAKQIIQKLEKYAKDLDVQLNDDYQEMRNDG